MLRFVSHLVEAKQSQTAVKSCQKHPKLTTGCQQCERLDTSSLRNRSATLTNLSG